MAAVLDTPRRQTSPSLEFPCTADTLLEALLVLPAQRDFQVRCQDGRRWTLRSGEPVVCGSPIAYGLAGDRTLRYRLDAAEAPRWRRKALSRWTNGRCGWLRKHRANDFWATAISTG